MKTVGEVIKNSTEAIFSFYRQGHLYYRIVVNECNGIEKAYTFPIEVGDLQTATVSLKEKPITLMRYIRKALENKTFVRSA